MKPEGEGGDAEKTYALVCSKKTAKIFTIDKPQGIGEVLRSMSK